jgi:hypothetical protein
VDGSILTALLFVTVFYQGYFQSPGVAEADLEHDVRFTVRTFLYDGSGDAPRPAVKAGRAGNVFMVSRQGGMLANRVDPSSLDSARATAGDKRSNA